MHDLPEGGQLQLMREISQCSRALQDLFKPTKMNVAAIGNMCTQLHIHVTCRVEGDPSTVVGMSLSTLRILVRKLGVDWTSLWRDL